MCVSIPCTGVRKYTLDIANHNKIPDLVTISHADLLKLRVRLHSDDYSRWNEIQTKLRRWAENLGATAAIIQPVKISKHVKLTRQRNTPQSDHQLISNYSKRHQISEDVLKTGLWLLDKAS